MRDRSGFKDAGEEELDWPGLAASRTAELDELKIKFRVKEREAIAHEQRLVNKLNLATRLLRDLRKALEHMVTSDSGHLPDHCAGCAEAHKALTESENQ